MSSNKHSHDHEHSHELPSNKKILTISFLLISIFMLVEFIGGYITNSLVLISDAGHMLSDAVALGIALFAVFVGQKSANAKKSFGYRRFEVLTAAINGITLIAIAVYIFVEAIMRFQTPQHIDIQGMLIISSLGLLINIVVAWIMYKGSDTEHDLNMQGAFLHVLSDLLGSIGAIIAGLCIYYFSWLWADPLASILVAILVLRSGIRVAVKSSHILMQGTPEQFDPQQVKNNILQLSNILDVHDLHIWSLTSTHYILSCHIVVEDKMTMLEVQQILHCIEQRMIELGIQHITIQTETVTQNHLHCENTSNNTQSHDNLNHHDHQHDHRNDHNHSHDHASEHKHSH